MVPAKENGLKTRWSWDLLSLKIKWGTTQGTTLCCAEKSADCLFVGWTEHEQHKQWQVIQCLSGAPECSSHQAPVQQIVTVQTCVSYTTQRCWEDDLPHLTVHLVRCCCSFILWRKGDKAKPFWLARRWMAYNLHCRAYARIIQITIRVYEVIRIATWNNSTMLRESVLESCFISIVRKTCTLVQETEGSN